MFHEISSVKINTSLVTIKEHGPMKMPGKKWVKK